MNLACFFAILHHFCTRMCRDDNTPYDLMIQGPNCDSGAIAGTINVKEETTIDIPKKHDPQ